MACTESRCRADFAALRSAAGGRPQSPATSFQDSRKAADPSRPREAVPFPRTLPRVAPAVDGEVQVRACPHPSLKALANRRSSVLAAAHVPELFPETGRGF